MKRFLIFGLLGPPLAGWMVGLMILPVEREGIPVTAVKALILAIAFAPMTYLFGLVPGLAMAGIDGWLARYPWRLPAACAIAYVAAGVILTWGSTDFAGHFLKFGFVGLIPTAICSWLSGLRQKDVATV